MYKVSFRCYWDEWQDDEGNYSTSDDCIVIEIDKDGKQIYDYWQDSDEWRMSREDCLREITKELQEMNLAIKDFEQDVENWEVIEL